MAPLLVDGCNDIGFDDGLIIDVALIRVCFSREIMRATLLLFPLRRFRTRMFVVTLFLPLFSIKVQIVSILYICV